MEIKVSKAIAQALGEDKMRLVGQEVRSQTYKEHFTVDLASLSETQLLQLREWFDDLVKLGTRGPRTLIKDIDTWTAALKGGGKVRARTLRHFSAILTEYLRKVPGHRVYQRLDVEGLAHSGYYVNKVTYHPPERSRDYHHPAYVSMDTMHIELGGRITREVNFDQEDAQGKSAAEALVFKGYFPETSELRIAYLEETDRFNNVAMNVGQQFLAIGTGTDNLDGNPGADRRWSSYSGRSTIPMVRDDQPSKVVIDVFYESEKERPRDRDGGYIDTRFWPRKKPNVANIDDDDEEFLESTDEKDVVVEESIEIPIHPFCATFDLRRHLRLRLHINYLTEYVYDDKIADRLVLPSVTKDLVATLISQSSVAFEDIVAGKSGGVCVLLTGVPGVGKTLTAEVFAEASNKPLYSIQAAQLGISADHIEQNLTRFLARGSRWGAVVLLDEADVYVRERDKDMEHNAVVASFLRVLEYQSSVLFMTTNRSELVDDAIASRCIARIDYDTPTVEQQVEIWQVLNAINKAGLSDAVIAAIVKDHPDLTGRDIKQLLKLAGLVEANHGESITKETIDFVSQFRPTKTQSHVAEVSGYLGVDVLAQPGKPCGCSQHLGRIHK